MCPLIFVRCFFRLLLTKFIFVVYCSFVLPATSGWSTLHWRQVCLFGEHGQKRAHLTNDEAIALTDFGAAGRNIWATEFAIEIRKFRQVENMKIFQCKIDDCKTSENYSNFSDVYVPWWLLQCSVHLCVCMCVCDRKLWPWWNRSQFHVSPASIVPTEMQN